jgi:hypothetical protein
MRNKKASNSTGLKEPFKIQTIQAFITTNDDGFEIISAFDIAGYWFPMVAADSKGLTSLRPIAESIAKNTGKPLTLAEFSVRTDLEVIL